MLRCAQHDKKSTVPPTIDEGGGEIQWGEELAGRRAASRFVIPASEPESLSGEFEMLK
ncbi:MAG: hypothetical protein ACNS63_00970 [Candidatus Nitrospinota bacterium M3_3B_026]